MKKIVTLTLVGVVVGGIFGRGIPTAAAYGLAGLFIGTLADAIEGWQNK